MKGTVVVNIADLMQRWTADKLKSTVLNVPLLASLGTNLFRYFLIGGRREQNVLVQGEIFSAITACSMLM